MVRLNQLNQKLLVIVFDGIIKYCFTEEIA